ncbi:MAG: nuclear transport factor 2 family protein [Gammaproteobacteria bacterium]|nr:MAG: nuclear transport factor 2 family protein [Gammaproteobacteria bacterium]
MKTYPSAVAATLLTLVLSGVPAWACDAPAEESAAAQATVFGFLQRFGAGDFDGLLELLSEDFVLRQAPSLPYAGRWEGHAGWTDFLPRFLGTWEDLQIELTDARACGDTVYLELDFAATARASGTRVSMRLVEIYRVRDGRIQELVPYYWDAHAIREAAGGPVGHGPAED